MQEVEPGVLDPREQAAQEFDLKNREQSEAEAKETKKAREKLISELVTEGRESVGRFVAGKILSNNEKVLGDETKVPWDHTLKNGLWVTAAKGEAGRIASFEDILNTREGQLAFKKFVDAKELDDQTLINELENRLRKLS